MKEKILKTYLAGADKDYHYIKLHKNGTQTPFEIHRLVAQAFIPNPSNKREELFLLFFSINIFWYPSFKLRNILI